MTRFSAGYGIVSLLLVSSLTSGCATSQSTAPAPPHVSPAYCTDHTRSAHRGDAEAVTLEREVAQFKELLEQSLMYRQETVRLAQHLKDKERVGTPLSGEDIDNLNLGTAAHLRLREKLYALALAHECWVDGGAPGLSPERRLTGVTVSLAAALTLYDNYLLAISAVEADTKLRRFINRADSGYQKRRSRLDSVTAQFTSVTNRQRVRKAMRVYEQEIARLSPQVRPGCDLAYLDAYLKQSPSYAMVREYAPFAVLKGKVDFLATVTTDTLISLEQEGVNLFSMLFGNATGMVATRRGKLYDRPTLADQIKKELRSGDILLEKTPFRMTDRFIPGFWGHAAVWVGSEEELKALGIWDDPAVRPLSEADQGGAPGG